MKKVVYYLCLLLGIITFTYTTNAQTVSSVFLEVSDGLNSRETKITLGNGSGYTTGLNPGYDGGLFPTSFEVYTMLVVDDATPTGTPFDVQSLPYSQIDNLSIEVGTIIPTDGTITFTSSITGDPLPTGHRIILEDRTLGVFTELQGLTDQYVVHLTSAEPELGRFYLHTTSNTTTPLAPTIAPNLHSASDTGLSDSDTITNDTTPSFEINCSQAGNIITLYTDNPSVSTTIGTHTCSGIGTETMLVSSTLAPGNHTITYTDTRLGFESGVSPTLSINIDTLVPNMPSLPVLLASSDSGLLGDHITNDDTPSFTVSCTEIGAILTPYISGVSNPLFSHNCTTIGTTTITPGFSFPEGTYTNLTYTETDTAGNESVHSTSISGLIDLTPPSTPSTMPDLESGSDSGASNSDDITNDDLPDITVICSEVDSTIALYSNIPSINTIIGNHTCTAIGSENASVSVSLSEGLHHITYSETDIAGNTSGNSPYLAITIDTIAPAGITINTPTLGLPVTGYTEVGASVVVTTSNGGTCTVSSITAGGNGIYPGVYNCHLSPKPTDKNDITAVATDLAGNSSSTTTVKGIKIVGGSTGGGAKSIVYARFPNSLSCKDIFTTQKIGGYPIYKEYLNCRSLGKPVQVCSNTWAKQVGLILCDGSFAQTNTLNTKTKSNQTSTETIVIDKKEETKEFSTINIPTNQIIIDGCKHEILYRNKEQHKSEFNDYFYADAIQNTSDPYYPSLIDLTQQGIISGRVSGKNNDVRRAELRGFVQRSEAVKLFSIAREDKINIQKTSNCLQNEFEDTTLDSWYYPYLDNMKKHNIIHGYGDGQFKPSGYITMAESYKITAISFGLITKEQADKLSALNNSPWYAPYKDVLYTKGVLPKEINQKKEHLPITRGEIIHLIAQSLNRNEQ